MKRVKRLIAMVLSGIMLCGIMVTTNAADSEHTHTLGHIIPGTTTCYNSFSSGTHSGSYGVCHILVNFYSARVVCAACNAEYTHTWIETKHTACGQ